LSSHPMFSFFDPFRTTSLWFSALAVPPSHFTQFVPTALLRCGRFFHLPWSGSQSPSVIFITSFFQRCPPPQLSLQFASSSLPLLAVFPTLGTLVALVFLPFVSLFSELPSISARADTLRFRFFFAQVYPPSATFSRGFPRPAFFGVTASGFWICTPPFFLFFPQPLQTSQ